MMKNPPKLRHTIKTLANKAAFNISVCDLIHKTGDEYLVSGLQHFRRNFRLMIFCASSKAYKSVKHDLLSSLISAKAGSLKHALTLTSHPILPTWMVRWFESEGLIPFFLSCLREKVGHNDYVQIFGLVVDILVGILRCRGGPFWLLDTGIVDDLIQTFMEITVDGENHVCEVTLIEEDNIPGSITPENLQSTARDMATLLQTLVSISDLLYQVFYIDDSLAGISSLYGYLMTSQKTTLVGVQLFVTICRVNPELVLSFVDRISTEVSVAKVEAFYAVEILKLLLDEDGSGEIGVLCGHDINMQLKSVFEDDSDSALMLNSFPLIQKTEIFNCIDIIGEAIDCILKAEQEIKTAEPMDDIPDLQLAGVGPLDFFQLEVAKIKTSIRILNSWYSLHKWQFISAASSGVLEALSTLLVKASQTLTLMIIDTLNLSSFHL
jgi:hypothetical protein